jgi:hypothetical protein
MLMHARNAGSTANTITFTLMADLVTPVPTALALTVLKTDVDGSNLVDSVFVPADSLIGIKVTRPSPVGNSPDDVFISVLVVPS